MSNIYKAIYNIGSVLQFVIYLISLMNGINIFLVIVFMLLIIIQFVIAFHLSKLELISTTIWFVGGVLLIFIYLFPNLTLLFTLGIVVMILACSLFLILELLKIQLQRD
jgi:hypothetical protein